MEIKVSAVCKITRITFGKCVLQIRVHFVNGAHPAFYPMGTGGSFPGGKARPGHDTDHSPPSSAEVKNEQELYLLSPHVPPWRVAGQLYFVNL
jgi:hypothetical protein